MCHGYTKNHGLTLDWREDGYCNEGNLPGAYIVGNTLRYQDLEWYNALKDIELKEEALRNKAIMEGLINEDVESNDKENEYEDLTSTSEDACRAYQEIFRMMDEGWMDLAEEKSTMLVKYLQSRNLEVLES
ncbi:hypothetical protein Tco_1035942 [Tanacetum coccineum]